MDPLQLHIEALVFCSSSPISVEEIQKCTNELFDYTPEKEKIEELLGNIREKFADQNHAFELLHVGGGYLFYTKPAYQSTVGIHLKQKSKKRLSASALETLSIIAYKQPVVKSEVEKIRGVGVDYAVQKLLEKGLLEIKGRAELPGKPVLYGTSAKFMEYLGINDLSDLPKPKDIAQMENAIGEAEKEVEAIQAAMSQHKADSQTPDQSDSDTPQHKSKEE